MASYLANAAAGQMFGDIQREWSDAVGGIRGRTSSTPQPTIDWANLNYPPLIRLAHYDPKELPERVAGIVKLMHAVVIVTTLTLLLTTIDNFVLAVGGVGWFKVVYSFLNMFIFIPASGYIFYEGYRGMALSDQNIVNKYVILQSILCFLSLLFALVPFGAFNGLAAFAFMKKVEFDSISAGTRGYWFWAIIAESVLWVVALAIGAWDVYRAKTYNPYHSQEARTVRGF